METPTASSISGKPWEESTETTSRSSKTEHSRGKSMGYNGMGFWQPTKLKFKRPFSSPFLRLSKEKRTSPQKTHESTRGNFVCATNQICGLIDNVVRPDLAGIRPKEPHEPAVSPFIVTLLNQTRFSICSYVKITCFVKSRNYLIMNNSMKIKYGNCPFIGCCIRFDMLRQGKSAYYRFNE